jgi:hypothetical protein
MKVFDPTGTNDIVKPSNVQVDGVHPPPVKAPVVEKVTVCAVAGSDPNATTALPTAIARAIRSIFMSPSLVNGYEASAPSGRRKADGDRPRAIMDHNRA